MKKYHFIYMTTNIENGKKYIGKHSTDDINDGYMGSGKIIKNILKKNPSLLKREIIEICNSEEEAYSREQYWINYYNAYESKEFYNLMEGGHGNTTKVMKDRWSDGVYSSEEYKQKQANIMKKRMQEDENLISKREEGYRKWWDNLSEKDKLEWKEKVQANRNNQPLSEELKEKIRLSQPSLKKVYCIEEPQIIFNGLKEAAKWAGLKESSTAAITRCIKGKQKSCGTHPVTGAKLHWKEVE